MLGIGYLRFRIIVTTMLLTSVVINALIMPLALPSPPLTTEEEQTDSFDYSDYKYVFINYASWIFVLLLIYGIGALTYSVVTKSATDIASVFHNFHVFVAGSEQLPPARPLSQIVVAFFLVSFASSMYMVEARRTDGPFLDGATRFAAASVEDEDAEVAAALSNSAAESEAARRDTYHKGLAEALNWIHAACALCFAVSFIRALQFE